MFVNFTSKQKQFINDIVNNKIKRINILEGSVRSGKTYVSLVAWIILLCKYEKTRNFLMVGKTVTSLKRNCLTLLEELCPKGTFSYSIVKKEAKLFFARIKFYVLPVLFIAIFVIGTIIFHENYVYTDYWIEEEVLIACAIGVLAIILIAYYLIIQRINQKRK